MSGKTPGVAIVVDQKWRDLPGAAALAVWLEERHGLATALFPYSQSRDVLVQHRPHVIVLTHANGSRNHAIIELARSIGTRIAIMQTEGRPNNLQTMEYVVGSGVKRNNVDLWFAWSNEVRDFMVSRDVLSSEKIVVAGSHRFDYYRHPLNRLVGSRGELVKRFGLDAGRPIVSLATNFTTADCHTNAAKREFLIRDWADLGLSRYPAYSDPTDFARRDFEARERTLEIVRGMLTARPEVQLLIKPHPAEPHTRYIRFIEDCKARSLNVSFVGVDYIWNLLNGVDVHIHRLCTTGVEAWFVDVPSIDLHVEDYHGWSLQLPGAASEAAAGNNVVNDASGLIKTLDYYLSGGRPSAQQLDARARYIERWLHRVDGRRCAVHAEHLAALAATAQVGRPALRERARSLGRAAVVAAIGDPWGSRRGLLPRRPDKADHLGQVDCRISSSDADRWVSSVRGIIRQQIESEGPREPLALQPQ